MTNLGNYGERQDSNVKDWGYYAHLSIYEFASKFTNDNDCLEIGCGTGYGSSHLKKKGAKSVSALDKDANVISILQKRHPDVTFKDTDLDLAGIPFDDNTFDTVFSSNVFEHIAYIDPVISDCCRVLKEHGVAIIAVPPINNVNMLEGNAKNFFHINNIPPWAWKKKLLRYFSNVEYIRHWVKPNCVNEDGTINRDDPDLNDFVFMESADFPDETITSIFVCKDPLEMPLQKTELEDCPDDWRPLKVSAEARQAVFLELQKHHEDMSSWWTNEISSLLSWIEQSYSEGTDCKFIIENIIKQMRFYCK